MLYLLAGEDRVMTDQSQETAMGLRWEYKGITSFWIPSLQQYFCRQNVQCA